MPPPISSASYAISTHACSRLPNGPRTSGRGSCSDRQTDRWPLQGEWVHLMDELSQSISRTRSDISSSRSALCVYLGSQGGRGEGGGKVQRVAHRSCNGCWQERRPPPYEARANAGATTGPGRTTRAITEVPQMCPIVTLLVSQCHFGLCTMCYFQGS